MQLPPFEGGRVSLYIEMCTFSTEMTMYSGWAGTHLAVALGRGLGVLGMRPWDLHQLDRCGRKRVGGGGERVIE